MFSLKTILSKNYFKSQMSGIWWKCEWWKFNDQIYSWFSHHENINLRKQHNSTGTLRSAKIQPEIFLWIYIVLKNQICN